jgi:hypothetical protein
MLATHTRIDFDTYVVVPVWYYCNSKCTFCMVEKQIGELPTVDFEKFKLIVLGIVRHRKHRNLVLSGAEVTTFEQLDRFVSYAASFNYFERIQIQTNARRLKDAAYVQKLVDAGLNEFFVSMHGLEDVHDEVTEAKGGYRETIQGIENLALHPEVNLITNTVLTQQNFAGLLPLLQHLCDLPTTEMHLWNYFPMAGTDTRNLIVDLKEFFAILPDILAIVEPSGKPLVLKGFPECLSLGKPGYFDNRFPLNLIDKAFWDNFDENQFGKCIYKSVCSAKGCFGLSSAYVTKHGDERDLLSPIHEKPCVGASLAPRI